MRQDLHEQVRPTYADADAYCGECRTQDCHTRRCSGRGLLRHDERKCGECQHHDQRPAAHECLCGAQLYPYERMGTYRWRPAQSDGGDPGCKHAPGAKQHRDQNL